MKDSYYFSHDSNARTDEKILPIRAKYGAKGYGIYFMIIEMLQQANAYQLLTNYSTIAYEIKEPLEDVKDVIENYNLFKIEKGFFWSESLKKRMKKRDEISNKRAKVGKLGGLAKAKQNSTNCLALKERKGKEIKENNIIPEEENLKSENLKKLEQWLSSFESVQNPKSYAQSLVQKYSSTVIKKTLNDSACTSLNQFSTIADFYSKKT